MSDGQSGKSAEPRTGTAQTDPALDEKAVAEADDNSLGLRTAVSDAECLLHYAAQVGTDIPAELINAILTARAQIGKKPLDPQVIVAFLSAYAKLSAKLAPVSAETVRASNDRIGSVVRSWGAWAIVLTSVVVILSLMLFVVNSIDKDIADGIDKANVMAAKVAIEVGAPDIGNTADWTCGEATQTARPAVPFTPTFTDHDLIVELQQFAASMRDILRSAVKVNFFVNYTEHNPSSPKDKLHPETAQIGDPDEALQLPRSLTANFRAAALCKIAAYQLVRSFAQNARTDAVVFYGSLTAYVLPVLFSLLGAVAFSLRDYSTRVRARTYHPSYTNSARIIVAVIAGAIIGLFSNITQEWNLPPLAVAFLVGYGVEIFFTFLDSMLVAFGAKKESAGTGTATGSG